MRTLLLIASMSGLLWGGKAQNKPEMETQNDSATAISEILENRYFKGIYEGDIALLQTVYHPGTLLFGDVQGQPYAKTLEQYLDGVQHRQSPKDSGKPFKGEICDIRVVNSIAIAEVKVTMYDFVYHEFLSFHQIDGKWMLVNKMISDVAGRQAGEKPAAASADTHASLIATLRILPGHEKEMKEALNILTAASNKEADCVQFEAHVQTDSPQTVVIYELYTSDKAFEAHKATPHAKTFFEFVKGKIADDKIEVVFLKAL